MNQWIDLRKPALVLAPMEGVTDSPMRALMSERGGFSYCVAEFLRVSNGLLPKEVYFRHMPELAFRASTPAGTPVQLQLLGGNAELMAQSAVRAAQFGAQAIDINFGCPAPTVNRHDGGATLLKFPERIYEIVKSVREALPSSIPVSAKLRLGWDNVDSIFLNAERAAAGGASWITIHARTKVQGYAPPVNWKIVGDVRRGLSIPVVANGDIWTREDFLKCGEETGCSHFMLGRGALADPSLIHFASDQLGLRSPASAGGLAKPQAMPLGTDSAGWRPLLSRFEELCRPVASAPSYGLCRIKQWLKLVHLRTPLPWFDPIKRAQSLEEIWNILDGQTSAESQMARLNSATTGSDLIEDADHLLMKSPAADLARLSAT